MRVLNKLVAGCIIFGSLSALVACLQEPANKPEGTTSRQSENSEFNNSDPFKKNYVELLNIPDYNKEYLENQSMGLDNWRRNEDSQLPGHATPKTAATVKYHGVIPSERDCDDPAARAWIYQDDEDSNNRSRISWSSSYTLPWGINDGNASNTRLRFCKVDASQFRRLPRHNGKPEGSSDYAVLTFGDQSCPNGGFSFVKYVRNETSRNNNSNSGNIALSNQNTSTYTDYYMCFYPDLPSNGLNEVFPNWSSLGGIGRQYYHVFASADASGPFWNGDKGYVYSDDEDNLGGGNSIYYYDMPGAIWTGALITRCKKILPHAPSGSYFNLYRATPPN